MIDIHCHILPGIDDGPDTWDQSLEMASIAAEDGIKKIVATPHFIKGSYEPSVKEVFFLTEELNRRIKREGWDLEIFPGMEVYLEPELPEMLKSGEIITLKNAGKYMLVEFPPDEMPNYSEAVFYKLRLSGIMPILAHPERNAKIVKNPQRIFPLVEKGLLTQVTTSSLLGYFGSKCQEIALLFLRYRLAHFIASDGHYNPNRMPGMSEAYDFLKDLLPSEYALSMEYNSCFAEGKYILHEDPIELTIEKKKGFFNKLLRG